MIRISGTRRLLLILSLMLSACAGCRDLGTHPACLVVLANARDVYYSDRGGDKQVTYKFAQKYPAKGALKAISDRLAHAGWKPLKKTFLNRDPSSRTVGWFRLRGIWSTASHTKRFMRWIGDWKNASGDIVMYDLDYRWPMEVALRYVGPPDIHNLFGPPDNDTLLVVATYMPAELAKRMISGRPRR